MRRMGELDWQAGLMASSLAPPSGGKILLRCMSANRPAGEFSYYRGDLYWNNFPQVVAHVNRLITGSPERGWVDHLGADYTPDRAPIAVAIYFTETTVAPEKRNAVLAAVGRALTPDRARRGGGLF